MIKGRGYYSHINTRILNKLCYWFFFIPPPLKFCDTHYHLYFTCIYIYLLTGGETQRSQRKTQKGRERERESHGNGEGVGHLRAPTLPCFFLIILRSAPEVIFIFFRPRNLLKSRRRRASEHPGYSEVSKTAWRTVTTNQR